MKIIECEQRSPEWFATRLGRLTASRAADMLATLKSGGEAAGRRNLRVQLVLERLTGVSQDSDYQSEAMRVGIEREPDALLWYEAVTGHLVRRTGFVQHDELMAGASLDGHVGDDGLVEIKCPLAATHLETIESRTIPGDYQKQIGHQFWITGAAWCDYASYNPAFPEPLRLVILRLHADAGVTKAYDTAARAFLAEVDAKVAALTARLAEVG